MGTESVRKSRLPVRSVMALSSGLSGIDFHGLLCVDIIAANVPLPIASSADRGVAFSLPWWATL